MHSVSAFVAPTTRSISSKGLRVENDLTNEVPVAEEQEDLGLSEATMAEVVTSASAATASAAAGVPAARRIKNSNEWYLLALPFMDRPAVLDGTLAADAGFDPAGFAGTREDMFKMREAEVKHARLAMLCAAGWPLAEKWDDGIATSLGLPSVIALNGGRDPSLLNGGLGLINPAYWVGVVAFAAFIEYQSETAKGDAKKADSDWLTTASWVPGDMGFDPFGLYTLLAPDDRGKFLMETAELKNGRLAMCAVFVYVLEEFVTGKAVVDNTPIFFQPFWKVVEDIMLGAPAPQAYLDQMSM